MKTLIFNNPDVVLKISENEAKKLGINIKSDTPFEIDVFGPWNIIRKVKGLAITSEFKSTYSYVGRKYTKIFGQRIMFDVKPGGYGLKGRVSINGKKYPCFDTTQLFDINGILVNVSCIFVKMNQ